MQRYIIFVRAKTTPGCIHLRRPIQLALEGDIWDAYWEFIIWPKFSIWVCFPVYITMLEQSTFYREFTVVKHVQI